MEDIKSVNLPQESQPETIQEKVFGPFDQMSDSLGNIKQMLENESNEMTADWFLISSPVTTVSVFILYVLFIKIIGPKISKGRECSDGKICKLMLILYNIFQIVVNLSILSTLVLSEWLQNHYSSACQENAVANSMMVEVLWYYYLSKFFDLFDNVFLIYDRRNAQISILNVLYDGFVLLSIWLILKIMPTGHISVFMLLDTTSHALIHIFCLFSSTKPRSSSIILTSLHILKTVAIVCHGVELVLYNRCHFPFIHVWFIVSHALFHIILIRSRFGGGRRTKISKSESEPSSIAMNSYMSPDATYVTFNNFGVTQNDVKQRYLTTIKTPV
ncbi:CLUMA_CG017666, isoform A [Clunio marinus]|uniref:Elongation of very long chain fatty acids protein n=1 Tax=Clunio marinus TaxID=568069 RepID=A0A1J1IZK2_9DIPT|nr:CLUMA_CG017666, isoform A [Clunio marinus]